MFVKIILTSIAVGEESFDEYSVSLDFSYGSCGYPVFIDLFRRLTFTKVSVILTKLSAITDFINTEDIEAISGYFESHAEINEVDTSEDKEGEGTDFEVIHRTIESIPINDLAGLLVFKMILETNNVFLAKGNGLIIPKEKIADLRADIIDPNHAVLATEPSGWYGNVCLIS